MLKSGGGAYMFPSLEEEGAAVGLLLDPDVDLPNREILESLMAELTSAFKSKVSFKTRLSTYFFLPPLYQLLWNLLLKPGGG